MARPMPRPAPVTKTRLPGRIIEVVLLPDKAAMTTVKKIRRGGPLIVRILLIHSESRVVNKTHKTSDVKMIRGDHLELPGNFIRLV